MTLEHIITEFDYSKGNCNYTGALRDKLLFYDGHCAIFNYNTSDYLIYRVDVICLVPSLFLTADYHHISSAINLAIFNLLQKKERKGSGSIFKIIKFETYIDSIRLIFAVKGNYDKDIADDIAFIAYERMENFFLRLHKLNFSSIILMGALERALYVIQHLSFLELFASGDSTLCSIYNSITSDIAI